jgi:hypothetical protein
MNGEGTRWRPLQFRERWFEENEPEGVAFEYEGSRIGRRTIMCRLLRLTQEAAN